MAFKMKGWNAGEGTGSAVKFRNAMAPNRQMMGDRMIPMMKEKLTAAEKTAIAQKTTTKKRYGVSPNKKTSALKSDWETALKNDPNLANLVKARNEAKEKHGKDSNEYHTAQNRVNVAYKNAKRHGVTETKDEKRGGKVNVTTKNVPGVGSETVKEVTDKDGNVKKIKTTSEKDSYYVPEGEKGSETTIVKPGKDEKIGTDDDKKKKRNKKRFRDTKLGRTKVGQKFVKKENRV